LLAISGGDDPYSLENNLVLRIDKLILGENHLSTAFGIPFDPLGLLSTIPAAVNVMIGYYTAELLTKKSASVKNILKILFIGAGLIGLGLLWGRIFPINKPLWTSSYVLYSSGLAMIILAFVYWVTDVLKFRG